MSIHGLTIITLVSIVIGIALGYRFPFASEVAVLLCVLAIVQTSIAVVSRKIPFQFHIAMYSACIAICIVVGIVRVQLVSDSIPFVCDTPCTIRGTVVTTPESRETYQRLVLSVSDEYAYVHAYVPLYPKYTSGDVLELTGIIKEPDVLFPHDEKRNGFDYVSYLSNQHIGSQMMYPLVQDTGTRVKTVITFLQHIEHDMSARVHGYMTPSGATLATGMLFGRDEMSKESTEMFRVAGVSHIVVLSGFNIAVIVSFILLVFRFAPLVLRIAIAFFATGMFVLMVGGEASIIRALLMASIALLATALGRGYVAKQALVVSFLAIIMYDPQSLLTDVSLHLSFIATAGIVYLAPVVKDTLHRIRIQGFLGDVFATTISAYIVTLPYQLHVFGSVSLYALIANLLIVPLVPIAMLFSFLTICVSYVWESFANVVGFVTSLLLDGMLGVISFISSFPFASISLHSSFLGMVLAYVSIVTLTVFFTRDNHETPLSENGVTKDKTIYTY